MYEASTMNASGINVLELPFSDGDPPPEQVVNSWLDIVEATFDTKKKKKKKKKMKKDKTEGDSVADNLLDAPPAIAVHCVAGLGRAPVLVAIALLETGLSATDTIALIRKKRRGAINSRQLKFLESYNPRNKAGGCCVIS
jgi:protein tyrosine phosphatase type 4A